MSAGRTVIVRISTATGFTLVVAVLILWLAGVFHQKIPGEVRTAAAARAARSAAGVRTAEARLITVPRVESAVGTIRAVHETAVASKILARVIEVNVQAGQEVGQGDVLVRLDDEDLRAKRQQAQAAVEAARAHRDQAQIEYDRVSRLFEQSAASKNELDQATTDLQAAKAELERAEQARREADTVLGYATIESPINGVVIDKLVEAGDTVKPGQVLLRLYDPKRMQLIARVRESLTRRLAVGQNIDVRVDALKRTCQGRISEIVPEAEAASRTFSVKVTGPCPPGVYSGMFGRLQIPLDSEQVLVIPAAAVRYVGQLNIVDVAQDGRLERRALQLGRTYSSPAGGDAGPAVEVLSGLRAGERVALPERQGEEGRAAPQTRPAPE
jgi:RND family efflux transporter MFP subunit